MLERLLSENFVKIQLVVSELQVKITESSVAYETLDIVKVVRKKKFEIFKS